MQSQTPKRDVKAQLASAGQKAGQLAQKAAGTANSQARSLLARAAEQASGLGRARLAWGGLALAGLTTLGVNLFAANALTGWRTDMTQEGLYTISDGTRRALSAIDEPIDLKVYYSRRLGDAAPSYAKSFERVRTLLDQYRRLSSNKLVVTYLDPQPFSDAEDRAVAAGLRGIRLNQEGELGYFGLAGTNSTDNEASIPFFAAERERFLEYDVTKLIYGLANPKKRVVGLLSSLPIDGGLDPTMGMRGRPLPPQLVMDQVREVFEVRTLQAADLKDVPADVDVLMLVQPDGLSANAVYAIDQFALRGGKVLLFVDPVAESFRPGGMMGPQATNLGEMAKLLEAWGITYDPAKVAADTQGARRVQFATGGARGGVVTDYIAWLGLSAANLDKRDVLSGGIERLNIASAGFVTQRAGATTKLQPILSTSANAMQIAADKVSMRPDALALLREFKPGGQPLSVAARVTGPIESAFKDGRPKPPAPATPPTAEATKADAAKAEAPSAPLHRTGGAINAVIVTDTDILNDQFWVEVRDFLGQQVAVPNAQNAAFVVGALENLSGSDALISLRGRGIADRPFETVETLRRDAERRFREKEQALTTKLQEVQGQLAKLETSVQGNTLIVSEKDQAAIERFRAEMLAIRRELRDVKLALRQDIDRLDGWLKFANIALIPMLIGAAGFGYAAWRRRRTATI